MGGSIHGAPLSLLGLTSTIAGVSPINARHGTGSEAGFDLPSGVTTDAANNTIRVIE